MVVGVGYERFPGKNQNECVWKHNTYTCISSPLLYGAFRLLPELSIKIPVTMLYYSVSPNQPFNQKNVKKKKHSQNPSQWWVNIEQWRLIGDEKKCHFVGKCADDATENSYPFKRNCELAVFQNSAISACSARMCCMCARVRARIFSPSWSTLRTNSDGWNTEEANEKWKTQPRHLLITWKMQQI